MYGSGAFSANWSRDGRWIYFASNRSGRAEVWKVAKEGGEAIQVTRSGGKRAFESPDGKYIYYDKSGSAAQSLFRMPVQGGEEEVVLPAAEVNPELWLSGFAVTAKGIYFFAPGSKAIQLMDATTGKVSSLATLDTEGYLLTASRDDRYLLWTSSQSGDFSNDIMLVENFR